MDLFDLTDKVVLFTGSSRGIGLAMAEAMAAAGARVVISSRNQQDCDQVAERINARHGANRAIALTASLANKPSLQALVDETVQVFSRIDVLVCNAATNAHFGSFATISDEQFRQTLEHNILANHWLVQMVAPSMVSRRAGSIIFVSSIGGLRATDMIGAYSVSKAADLQFVRNLALEYGKHNVRVNAIAPGTIRTEFARPLWEDPQQEALRASLTVLGRIGEPSELAGAGVFLASNASSFVTGHTLVVDGGRTI